MKFKKFMLYVRITWLFYIPPLKISFGISVRGLVYIFLHTPVIRVLSDSLKCIWYLQLNNSTLNGWVESCYYAEILPAGLHRIARGERPYKKSDITVARGGNRTLCGRRNKATATAYSIIQFILFILWLRTQKFIFGWSLVFFFFGYTKIFCVLIFVYTPFFIFILLLHWIGLFCSKYKRSNIRKKLQFSQYAWSRTQFVNKVN